MSLSDLTISKAKPGPKPQRISDGGGLYLEISPSGGKLWRFKYRFPAGGLQKVLAIGTYPAITLQQARSERDAAKRQLAAGIDPNVVKKEKKQLEKERHAHTFEIVAREWMGKMKGRWVSMHMERTVSMMELHLFPHLGNRPVAEITSKELLFALNKLVEKGKSNRAIRALGKCTRVFRYAIASGYAQGNPAEALKGAIVPPKPRHFESVTDPITAAELMRAIHTFNGWPTYVCALRLAPLVFVRPNELSQAAWSEFNLTDAIWEIPAERMKMGQGLVVPLSRQAMAILTELHKSTGHRTHVFPSAQNPEKPMHRNRLREMLAHVGFGVGRMTGHGFRAMARTMLDEVLEIRPDYIEQQLAHVVRDPNGRAYNRTKHLVGRREMMQKWSDYLYELAKRDTIEKPKVRRKLKCSNIFPDAAPSHSQISAHSHASTL